MTAHPHRPLGWVRRKAPAQRERRTAFAGYTRVATFQAARERWGRGRRHALADEWLLWGAVPHEESNLLGPRGRELTSAKSRRSLARICRRYVAEIRDPPCRAFGVNRKALAEHAESLAQLGARIADLDKPLSARSVILAREVVAGDGPLFNHARAAELGPALKRALRALAEDERHDA